MAFEESVSYLNELRSYLKSLPKQHKLPVQVKSTTMCEGGVYVKRCMLAEKELQIAKEKITRLEQELKKLKVAEKLSRCIATTTAFMRKSKDQNSFTETIADQRISEQISDQNLKDKDPPRKIVSESKSANNGVENVKVPVQESCSAKQTDDIANKVPAVDVKSTTLDGPTVKEDASSDKVVPNVEKKTNNPVLEVHTTTS